MAIKKPTVDLSWNLDWCIDVDCVFILGQSKSCRRTILLYMDWFDEVVSQIFWNYIVQVFKIEELREKWER